MSGFLTKTKRVCLAIAILILPFAVDARTDCPEARVKTIQIEDNKVMYQQENGPWRTLGFVGDIGFKERYSALLTSKASSQMVVVGYPDGYNCSDHNYSTRAIMVRLN